MIYHANATRDDRFWLVHVPEVDRHTQARTVDEIELMARDLIAIMTGADASSVELRVTIELPASVRTKLDRVERARETERAARADAAAELRAAAIELKRTGMSVRELGRVLGVSYQRAGQLTSEARRTAS
jgi:predicted RNase H-like HicB family nuclease